MRGAPSPFLIKDKAVNFNYATSSNIRHLSSNSPADFTTALKASASSGVPMRRGIKAACLSSLAQRLSLKRRRLANFVPFFCVRVCWMSHRQAGGSGQKYVASSADGWLVTLDLSPKRQNVCRPTSVIAVSQTCWKR